MKKQILCSLFLFLISLSIISAQTGRPQYKIRNERAGIYIGDITIELFPLIAPLHCANFDSLVTVQMYDSTAWHRVVPNFVIQGGDPNSKHGPRNTWGNGDPSQATVPAEFSKVSHLTGIIGAARDTDINSATSQFYINTADNTGLDGNYTAYGVVISGMDVVDDIENSPRDNNDNPNDKIEMFITKIGMNESAPNPPTLMEPVDGITGVGTGQRFSWTLVEDAVLYYLEIAEDQSFTQMVYADSFAVTPPSVSTTAKNLETGLKTYYWRVRSNNGAKFSNYTEVRSFTTSILAPVQIYPAQNATEIPRNTRFEWNEVGGAVSYYLQVSSKPLYTAQNLVVDQSGITATNFTADSLNANTIYYWRVLGVTEIYEGPSSASWKFTTGQLVDVEDEDPTLPKEYYLAQNGPNPFNPSTYIKYNLKAAGHVTMKVYDILGRELFTILDEYKDAGRHVLFFEMNDLATGIYIYSMRVNDYYSAKKMVVLK
ncbi:MAG: peptidylprolyl isomerase [bacterium]